MPALDPCAPVFAICARLQSGNLLPLSQPAPLDAARDLLARMEAGAPLHDRRNYKLVLGLRKESREEDRYSLFDVGEADALGPEDYAAIAAEEERWRQQKQQKDTRKCSR